MPKSAVHIQACIEILPVGVRTDTDHEVRIRASNECTIPITRPDDTTRCIFSVSIKVCKSRRAVFIVSSKHRKIKRVQVLIIVEQLTALSGKSLTINFTCNYSIREYLGYITNFVIKDT